MIFAHIRRILVLVITVVVAAVTTFPTRAEANTVTFKEIIPFEDTLTACNGEDVFVTGELVIIFHETVDPSGGFHRQVMLIAQGFRGVGALTGTEYLAIGSNRQNLNFDTSDGNPLSFTFTAMFNLVSQGNTDNLRVTTVQHVTVSPTGNVIVNSVKSSTECVG